MFSLKKSAIKREEIRPVFKINPVQGIFDLPELTDKTRLDVKYPLIEPYAYAHIYWDNENHELVYELEEPSLSEDEQKAFALIEKSIEELINISFIAIKSTEVVIEYLEKNIRVLLNEFRIKVSDESFNKMMYYIYRDFVGLNEIEPVMRDYYIEDIECNGVGFSIYVVHRKYRNLRTNIIFKDINKLTSFVEKLAQKCGKYISYATPLLDGSLPNGSRANATYTQDITSRGPSFTIRKFTSEPFSPTRMIQLRTVSPEMLAYLWLLIEYESNILVIGGTGSGKTSFLNSIAFFIPPQARIVSIEDTREIALVHENWLPSVAREGIGISSFGGEKHGEVSLFQLLKESFRQRPDYVIVGEIRGQEAFVLFQGMSSIRGTEEILVLNDEHPKKIEIKDLIPNVTYKAICFDEKGYAKIMPIKARYVHPKRNKLHRIITKKGREITLTPNHSIFSFEGDKIVAKYCENLNIGDNIIIPARIPSGYANIDYANLLEIGGLRIYAPSYVKEAVRNVGYEKASKICKVKSISDFYSNFKRCKCSSLPTSKFLLLMKEAGVKYDLDKIKVKSDNNSFSLDAKLKISDELLRLLGYYISEGSLQNNKKNSKLCLYSKNKRILDDMKYCIKTVVKEANIKERMIDRGYGWCNEISFSHKPLLNFIEQSCGKGSLNKRMPSFIFGLSKERIGQFLSGLYSGDGCFTDNYFGYYTISKELANDIVQLLNVYGIVATIRKRERRANKDYEILFYNYQQKKEFLQYVSPIREKIPLKKGKYSRLINDVYVDKIKKVEIVNLKDPEHVYDISVPGAQNFIGGFGGIVLHNSGHPSFGTMHAENVETLIRRLETKPIELSPSLVESLDAIVIMTQLKTADKSVRKVKDIVEIIKVQQKIGSAITNTPFVWDPRTDRFFFSRNSKIFDKLVTIHGVPRQKLALEFRRRTELLMKMYWAGIINYKEVQDIITTYYKIPDRVLKKFNIR